MRAAKRGRDPQPEFGLNSAVASPGPWLLGFQWIVKLCENLGPPVSPVTRASGPCEI